MAVFNKSKKSIFDNFSLAGIGNTKPITNVSMPKSQATVFTNQVRSQGQSTNQPVQEYKSQFGKQIVAPFTGAYKQQNVMPKSTKATPTPAITTTIGIGTQPQTQQMTDYQTYLNTLGTQTAQAGLANQEAARRATELYQTQAPEILGTYEQQISGYQQQQADIQRQMEEARQRGMQTEAGLQQQYAQQMGETATSSEADLRRAAEARRVQQAQLEQKFANLGTLGSTGYFGQTGETQRAESEFLRGQQDIMAARTKAISDLNTQKNNAIMNAQNNVQTLLNQYQTQINDISNNINITYRDKVKMANDLYSNLEKRLTDLDKASRDEINTLNKNIMDIEMERTKQEAKTGTTATATAEIQNAALNTVNRLLESPDLGKITGRVRTGGTVFEAWTGAAVPQGLYDQLKSQLSLENIKYLKGTGQISDREGMILERASTVLRPSMSENEFRNELLNVKGALSGKVRVVSPEGEQMFIDKNELMTALQNGYKEIR